LSVSVEVAPDVTNGGEGEGEPGIARRITQRGRVSLSGYKAGSRSRRADSGEESENFRHREHARGLIGGVKDFA